MLNGGSALSLTNGSEEKSLQGQGFKAWSSIAWKPGCQLFLFYQFQECKQLWKRIYTLYDHFKGYLASITLFYDYNMLFIEKIYDTETFVIFFSKSSKQVHKVVISKDFIWSSYNIHCVSLHHK